MGCHAYRNENSIKLVDVENLGVGVPNCAAPCMRSSTIARAMALRCAWAYLDDGVKEGPATRLKDGKA
jgi:hypothetical protein